MLLIGIHVVYAQTPAFPNAEGFGKYSKGGRGGVVYKVTNLNNDGPGSLREACEASGARTVVFEVSGIIDLSENIQIVNDEITIAGQTAPGDGICIKGAALQIEASDVIVRYIRFRTGDNGYKDATGNIVGTNSADSQAILINGSTGGTSDIIFDHCSLSWSIDELVEIYGDNNPSNGVTNVTFQYCMFSEALYDSHNDNGPNSLAFRMSENTDNVSLFKNIFSNNREGHIRSEGGCSFEMINNVVYNFKYSSLISTANHFAMINNHYKYGNYIVSSEYIADYTFQAGYNASQTEVYVSGNTTDAFLDPVDGSFLPFLEPSPTVDSGIVEDSVVDMIDDVLNNSGAILPLRDPVDSRIINEYNSTSGAIIDTQEQVGGYPVYNSNTPLVDTDNDGMPDVWEIANNLNINNVEDRNDLNNEGYTNLELYLNGIGLGFSAGQDVTICEGESIILSVEGGSNVTWSNGSTDNSVEVSPLVTTTYTVNGIDSNGFSVTDEVTVFVNEVPEANAGENLSICQGESTVLTANGGGESYLWSTGETTQSITISPTATTTYSVTVTANDCSATDEVIVTVNPLPYVNAGNDKTIELGDFTVLVATGGDSYVWNTGATTASIIVSPSETTIYSVTATSNGCTATDEVTVFVINDSVDANAGEDQTICEGESVILTASGGDSYMWNTGATTQSITVSPNTTTEYTVTATINNSSDTDSVIVNVNSLPIAEAGEDQTICEGESVTLTANGGDSYVWNTGATTQSITVSPNTITEYSVTVTSNNCESTDSVIVNVNSLPIADAGEDVSIIEGESVTLTANGGDNYLWNTGATTQSITVSPYATTMYSVTVTSNNCESTDSVVVTVNAIEVIADAGEDETICEGESVTLTANGGDSYVWNTGATTQSIMVSPNTTTEYTVTATINNSSDTDSVIVNVNSLPIAEAGEDQTICEGESVTLTANGGDSYVWNTGATTQSITVSPNTTTEYSVVVTSNNCESTDDVIVNVNPLPIADAGEDVSIVEGESVTLTANGGNSYVWNTGATTQSIIVSPNATTEYSVVVSSNSCESTDSVVVTVNTIEVIADAGEDQTICEGESVILTASGGDSYVWNTGATSQSITVSPDTTTEYTVTATINNSSDTDSVIVNVNPSPIVDAGEDQTICEGESVTLTANGGDSYVWNTGATMQSITVSPNTTTEYSVTVTSNNCESTDNVIVNVNPLPIADAGEDVSVIEGESVTLTANGGDSYVWNTGATTQSITVSPNATTEYSVVVTSNNCESTDSVVVIVNAIEVIADAGEDQTICEGESVTLIANGGDSYVWNTGATTQSITVSPNTTTEYTVTATINNSSDTDSVIVNVNPLPIADAGEDETICEGESVTLTGSGGDSYVWNTGATTQSITVSPNTTAEYSVTVTSNNCESTDNVIVNVNLLPIADAGEDVSIIEGESVTLTANGGDNYVWNTGATTQSIIVSPNATTEYSVVVSSNNCESTDSVVVTVTEDNISTVNANAGEDVSICEGESVTLTATGGDNYLWSTGAITQSITVSPIATSNYTVIVSNELDSDTDEVTVFVNPLPVVDVTNDVTILEGDYITLSASGADTYEWTNGATQPNIAVNPMETTTFGVLGMVNNCSDYKEVTVTVIETVTAYAGEDVYTCPGEEITLTAEGGENYLWSNGATTQSITVTPNQDITYTVIVSNELDSDADEISVFMDNCDEDIPQTYDYQYQVYLESEDFIVVKVSGLHSNSNISIHDVLGNLIHHEKIETNGGVLVLKKINISQFNSGIYLIRLEENGFQTTRRIIFP